MVMVGSIVLPGIDETNGQTDLLGNNPTFGSLLFEVATDSGWPLAVVWASDGHRLAYCTQGGCVALLSGFSFDLDGQLIVKVPRMLGCARFCTSVHLEDVLFHAVYDWYV